MTGEPAPTTVASLAGRVGRGVGLTLVFGVLLQLVTGVQSLVVPRLLGPETVGLFALAMAIVRMGNLLKDLGTHQKLVQDRRHDLPLSYSVAFTMEMVVASVLFTLVVLSAPLLADFYDERRLGFVVVGLATMVYAHAFLELPSALYLRRLDYLRRNVIQAIGPLTNFAVTVPLAFAGAGVWSLVAGSLAALGASVWAVTRGISLRPRLHLDRSVLRDYMQFGWPLWLASLLGIASTLGGTIVVSRVLGVAGLGFFSVAQGFVVRVLSVDLLVAQAVFPALAATQEDVEGHRRAFQVTNRITMMWASAVGFGFALFAGDLVDHVLGPDWQPAVPLFRAAGVAIGLGSVGYSWDMFFRARGETRPTLVFKVLSEGWVFVVLLPLVALFGIAGAAWATASLGGLALVVRQAFIRRLFPSYSLLGGVWREVGSAGVVAGAVAAARWLGWTPESFPGLVAQAAAYLLLLGALLLVVDRGLIRSLIRVVRHRVVGAASPPLPSTGEVVEGVEPESVIGWDSRGVADDVATRTSGDRSGRDALVVPGDHPRHLAADGDLLWVSCRDSSELLWRHALTDTWGRARFPAWPEDVVVDGEGTAWSPLVLAGAVAWCRPDGSHGRIRLARKACPTGGAALERGCVVLDTHRCQAWVIDRRGAVVLPLPAAIEDPAAVAAQGNEVWVLDRGSPVIARVAARDDGQEPTTFGVTGPGHATVIDEQLGVLWLVHTHKSSLGAFDLSSRSMAWEVELPGVAASASVVPDVGVAVAIPDADAVAIVASPRGHGPARDVTVVHLPTGSQPTSLAPHRGSWWAVAGPQNCLWQVAELGSYGRNGPRRGTWTEKS